jgi:hypothetical protein
MNEATDCPISVDTPGLSYEDRARALCDALYIAMRRLGIVTTAHYESEGRNAIIRAFEAVALEANLLSVETIRRHK